jgi:Zn-finger protein
LKLHGSANFSPWSFCKSCGREILETSRTKQKSRCENCGIIHADIIKKLSSERYTKMAKEKRIEKRKQKKKEKN